MPEIIHRLRVSAPAAAVFRELTLDPQLSGSWGDVRMRVLENDGDAKVAWQCIDGPSECVGTIVVFDLVADGAETIVRLVHRNWRELSDRMADSATRWAGVLFSMKRRVEMPEPDDVLI